MAVEKQAAATQLVMDTLANLANSKSKITDKPFKFLPPVRLLETEAAMLRWWGAENGGNVFGGRGGIAVITTGTPRAFQLVSPPHTNRANWLAPFNFAVWRGSPPPGSAGMFGVDIGSISGSYLRRWSTVTNRWEVYLGWRGELQRMRGQCFSKLFGGGYDSFHAVERDDEWYWEPRFQSYRGIWSDEVLPFNTSNSWSVTGWRPELFKDSRYVYADNGTPTRVNLSASFSVRPRGVEFAQDPLTITTKALARVKGRDFDSPALMTITIQVDITHPSSQTATNIPAYEIIDTFGFDRTEDTVPRGPNQPGRARRIFFTATKKEWSGGAFEVGVRLIPPFNGYSVGSGGSTGRGRLEYPLEESTLIKGIHSTLPIRQIAIPDTETNEPPPGAWTREYTSGNQIPAPIEEDIWNFCVGTWLAVPEGNTTGFWLARPMPLSNVEFEQQFQPYLPNIPGVRRSLLQRWAKAANVEWIGVAVEHTDGQARTGGTGVGPPTDRDYYVSRNTIYQVPKVYIREVKQDTTTADLAYQARLWPYGQWLPQNLVFNGAGTAQQFYWRKDIIHGQGMIYSVTVRRRAEAEVRGVQPVVFAGGAVRNVVIGYITGDPDSPTPGAFKALGVITLGRSQESNTIYPEWPIFDGTSLAFKSSTHLVSVFATIVPKSPGASKIYDAAVQDVFNSQGTVTPIMAAHYNDTEAMLNALDSLP